MKKNYINKSLLVLLISFILSIFTAKYNLINYDKIVTLPEYGSYHQMIKTDSLRYMSHGNEIKKQLDEEKIFFSTGRENYTKYLPSRIAAIYYYILDLELFEDTEKKIVKVGIHNLYLFIQCLIYFFSLIFFYLNLKKKFNEKILFYILVFLSLEPTIFQYHGTFWSESIFFSIQIFLLTFILKENKLNYEYFLIGFLVGILSLQKQLAIFYIFPLTIYHLIFLKNKKIFFTILVLSGYFLVQIFLGFNNLSRSGKFYLMTSDTKLDLHRDLVAKVISKKMNITRKQFTEIEGIASKKWIEDKKIRYNQNSKYLSMSKGFMEYRSSILNESDRVLFDNFIRKRTFNYFKNYPLDFIKFITKSSIHTILLNPFHIYSDHNFRSGEYYYTTETHDRLVPVRIIYTLAIYLICIFGFINILIKKEYNLLFFLILSIIYFYGLVSWHGNTRYFVPNLIYISIFFGYGIDKIFKKMLQSH
jgi:hypothetical protein